MGAGKSTVARWIAVRGRALGEVRILDADRIGHAVIAPDGEAYDDVLRMFGGGVRNAVGEIDRARLGEIVFQHREQLWRLNALTHPHIAQRIRKALARLRAQAAQTRTRLVLLDAAVLWEAGWERFCTQVWTVYATPAQSIPRVIAQRGFAPETVRARSVAQAQAALAHPQPDAQIHNNDSLSALHARLEALWPALERAIHAAHSIQACESEPIS